MVLLTLIPKFVVELNLVGEGHNDPNWILENVYLFIGLMVGLILLLILGICFGCYRYRKKRGKSVDPKDIIMFNDNITCCHFLVL